MTAVVYPASYPGLNHPNAVGRVVFDEASGSYLVSDYSSDPEPVVEETSEVNSDVENVAEVLNDHFEQGGVFATANGHTDVSAEATTEEINACCGRKNKALIWAVVAFFVIIALAMCS